MFPSEQTTNNPKTAMPFSTTIPQAVLDTVLDRLALLFLTAAGNLATARQAAADMLVAYKPETPDELSLASEIISFGLHALEALSYASDPDLSLNRILRLRGSAVSLSREQHKAHRRLDQLQRDRRAGLQPQPTEARPTPKTDNALGLIEAARTATQPGGKITWSQAFQKRQLVKRMAENAKKNQAKHASQLNATASVATDARLSG
jgi:hypothetical protein